ncbi:MAG: protein phosphatase 2C domain-containing protein [Chloroflexota bacterium]
MNLLKIAYHSERGRRENNEDMYGVPQRFVKRLPDERGFVIQPRSNRIYAQKGYLFLLADGVGGYQGGELASQAVIEEVAARYYQDPSPDLMTSLQRVIEAANRQLRRQRLCPEQPARMSTTLVAAAIQQRHLFIASVGDSRVYHIQDKQATLLTSDHSWVQTQVNQGQLTVAEAAASSQKHRITRCLGTQDQVGVDTWHFELAPKERLLLCSDGISGHLDEPAIARLARQSDLQQAVNGLIDTAYDNNSADNMSAVLIEMNNEQ